MVVVTEFIDYAIIITGCLQNAKSLKNFGDFVVQGLGSLRTYTVNWSEDKDFP